MLAVRGGALGGDVVLRLVPEGLDLLVGLHPGGLRVAVGLGAGPMRLPRRPLGQLLALGAGPGQHRLGLDAHLLGGVAGGGEGLFGGGALGRVGPLLLGPAGGQGDLEVADAVVRVGLGLGPDPLGLGEPGGDVVGGRRLDRLGLLLGEREDLLDARAEMAERDLGADAGRPAGLGGLLLEPLDLGGHRLHLRIGLFALGGQRGDLVLGAGHIPLDLLLFIAPQGCLEAGFGGHVSAETEDFTAVRHAVHPHIRYVPHQTGTHRRDRSMRLVVICLTGLLEQGYAAKTSQAAPEKLRYGLHRCS